MARAPLHTWYWSGRPRRLRRSNAVELGRATVPAVQRVTSAGRSSNDLLVRLRFAEPASHSGAVSQFRVRVDKRDVSERGRPRYAVGQPICPRQRSEAWHRGTWCCEKVDEVFDRAAMSPPAEGYRPPYARRSSPPSGTGAVAT